MSPRPGGESDKIGNQYEAAWTVLYILEVLLRRAESITIEKLGDAGDGAEFIVERRSVIEAHQLKRQHGRDNEWGRTDLQSAGIFEAARGHVANGRQFHFVSTVPSQTVNELAGRAQRSENLEDFLKDFTAHESRMKAGQEYLDTFNYISKKLGSPEVAWDTLRGLRVRCVDDRLVTEYNGLFASLVFKGNAPAAAALALRGLIDNSLGIRLNRDTIVAKLPEYDLELADPATMFEQFRSTLPALLQEWQSGVASELLTPHIVRPEVLTTADLLRDRAGVFFVTGSGGSGKSAVLHDVVKALHADGWPAVAFRIDREQSFSSSFELGQRHGLGTSPVSALGSLATDQPAVLVIDQLDAVSLASGRMPETFYAIAAMLREASAFPSLRVLVACRKFDLENDSRIRTMLDDPAAQRIDLEALSDEQVTAAVAAMGIAPGSLTAHQTALLASPFALKLLSEIAGRPSALTFGSLQDLQEAFWDFKARACNARRAPDRVRFGTVIRRLATQMSEQQTLALSWSIFDEDDLAVDAEVLVSEHVLVKHGRQVSFFHESFFDYAFARQWSMGKQSLLEFVTDGEQELFRRSQVRQILVHFRQENPTRFRSELKALLLSAEVRFHLKQVAIAIVRGISDPTAEDWALVQEVLEAREEVADHLWLALRTRPWFERIDAEGDIAAWLTAPDDTTQNRALEIALGAMKDLPDRMAELLAPHAGTHAGFPGWLRWVTRFADVHKSRPLFELLLDSVRQGEQEGYEHDLFMNVYGLGKHQPVWAVELLRVYLSERADSFPADPTEAVPALSVSDHGAIEMVTDAASGAPREFAEQLTPYLINILQREVSDDPEAPRARTALRHTLRSNHHSDLESALLTGVHAALQQVVADSGAEVSEVVRALEPVRHMTAQGLMYEALSATSEPSVAEYAASLLLDRADGFYATHDVWAVRELVAAILPLVTPETAVRLDVAVLALRPSWEKRGRGRFVFTILAGIPEERQSPAAQRRLGELRRQFGAEPQRSGIMTEWRVGSPIPESAAARMDDGNWLNAMRRHNSEREWPAGGLGGAAELSQVLYEAAKKDAGRFASLALQLDTEINPAYGSALLRGLGDSESFVEPASVFNAVLHLGTLGHEEIDRWLAWAIRGLIKQDIPNEVVDLLVGKMISSPDPGEYVWREDVDDGDERDDDPLSRGINCVRGHTAEILGNYLVYDADGSRTARVVPVLRAIAVEPSPAVKSCSAHLLSACLRHAEAEVTAIMPEFFNVDDRLLVSRYVERLIVHVSYRDLPLAQALTARMLTSPYAMVRRGGGELAMFLGLEHEDLELLKTAAGHEDGDVRRGAAEVAAGRLSHTSRPDAAKAALLSLFSDPDQEVRKAASNVGGNLRGQALEPFMDTLSALIGSPAFEPSVPQLFITLQDAPDRVHGLIVQSAKRFLEVYGTEAGDIRTGAAGDAHYVGDLSMRAYAQARDVTEVREALDLIDGLLKTGAYGIGDLLAKSDRMS